MLRDLTVTLDAVLKTPATAKAGLRQPLTSVPRQPGLTTGRKRGLIARMQLLDELPEGPATKALVRLIFALSLTSSMHSPSRGMAIGPEHHSKSDFLCQCS